MSFPQAVTQAPRPARRRPGTHVLVAGDDGPHRRVAVAVLEAAADIVVAGVCEVVDVTGAIAQTAPDVLLLDADLRGDPGRALLASVMATSARVRTIVRTEVADPVAVLEALVAGGSGYLLTSGSPGRLVQAVHEVMDGRVPLCLELVTAMRERLLCASSASVPATVDLEGLTRREVTVLGHLTAGRTNAEIATALVLSAGTVKVHVQHIIAKLGVENRTQAAVYAARRGLLGDS